MLLTALSLLLAPQVLPAPQEPSTELRAVDLKARIGFLASDSLEGRESGKRGGHAAARYFAKEWDRLGLLPIGEDDSYLLPFQLGGLTCYNTAGLLPGTDPALADQILVIGGHHDHAGIGGPGAMGFPGEIHNGADDNASGSSGTAELAEWFVAHPIKRPILFMTFSAEERGLNGSADFVKNGPIEKDRMWAMINMDMIGRSVDDYLFIGGMGTAVEFHEILDPVLDACNLNLEIKDAGQAPSDNTSFYQGGIPALFFFTNVHDDYHMPSDDAEGINYDGEIKILEVVRDCVHALDAFEGGLEFERVDGMAMPDDFMDRTMDHYRRIGERNRLRGKLGVSIEADGDGGMRISKVRADSAGAAAGVQVGDLLVEVNGKAIGSKDALRRALAGGMKGDLVPVVLQRGGERIELEVALR